jgi:YHS domain-containing protein
MMNQQPSRNERDPKATNDTHPLPDSTPRHFDPVCGMDVDLASTTVERVDRKGVSYYFCSADCRRQFEANPEEFTA